MVMHEFKVYYDGGKTYTGEPFDAPGLGVLLIVEKDQDHGRRIVSNGDYYVWNGRWWAKDFVGMIDYLLQPGPRKVLVGRMVPNERFYDTYRVADSDPDFPVRTGHGAFERV